MNNTISECTHIIGTLREYATTDTMRPATIPECLASLRAALLDGGAGVIKVRTEIDEHGTMADVPCYVDAYMIAPSRIRALRAEAIDCGDREQESICDRALISDDMCAARVADGTPVPHSNRSQAWARVECQAAILSAVNS